MIYSVKNMTDEYATEILRWHYEPPYDFYNNEPSDEAREELLENNYFAVIDQNGDLFGFYCIGPAAQVPIGQQFGAYDKNCMDIGLGMKPEHTGQKNGSQFFSYILERVQIEHPSSILRLTVAAFNERAIHLYEKHGFQKVTAFMNGSIEFITMEKE